MTHNHDHDHHHDHDHDHNHDHEHDAEPALESRFHKILDHWCKHNAEHADTYLQWAQKAKNNGMPEIGDLLDQAAELTRQINPLLEQALDRIPHRH